jgi:uncharacterized membrane protein YgaE (UPF0421/DUF939 family)
MNPRREIRELKRCVRILERLAWEESQFSDELKETILQLKEQRTLLYRLLTLERFRVALREPSLLPSAN